MSKFAIGEKVDHAADDDDVGTVIAIVPTVEGNVRLRRRYGRIRRAPVLYRRKISRPPVLIHSGARQRPDSWPGVNQN
jgi:hypothetical protein